jgi:hypothetical protein
VDILPCCPYGAFNLIDLFVRDLGKGGTFVLGEFALVLQNEFDQKRCPPVGHVNDIENCAKGRIKNGDKSDLVSQIAPDRLLDATIEVLGFWRGIEIAKERSSVIMHGHPG